MRSNTAQVFIDLKLKFEQSFSNLPISVVCRNMAIVDAEEHPIQFEFVTNTVVDKSKRQITTFINEIEGTIPGIITLGTANVIPQHIHLDCEYEILTLSQYSLEKLVASTTPILTYSEWLLEAIKQEILILEVKTDSETIVDLPVGIKNADFL